MGGAGIPSTTIVGSYLSPYVRKVLVTLDLKGIDYQIDPIVPFFGNDEFSKLSPLRRIPVLIDDQVTLTDSTVICEYLEDRYPEHRLRPTSPADRARARWLEEFADTRMGDVFIWRLFNEVAIRKFVWGETPDEKRLQETIEVEIPQVLDYLEENLLPTRSGFFDELSTADIAVASFFRNAAFSGYKVDSDRWPRVADFVAVTLALPSFAELARFEEISLRNPIPQHREAVGEAGAPITESTYGTSEPRRGVMPI